MGLNMNNLGLGSGAISIFDEPESKSDKNDEAVATETLVTHTESEFVYKASKQCPVCENSFKILAPTNTKLRRLEPDFDLRPRFEYIDTVKYDVISCPKCGYSAMTSTFSNIDSARIKLIRQEICANFTPERLPDMDVYTYEFATDRYKLALINTVKKRGKMAERAYCSLKLAWLYRAQMEALEKSEMDEKTIDKRAEIEKEYNIYYKQAYDGFLKAIENETPPYCGLDSATVEFMVANMALYLNQLATAAKIVSKLLTAATTPRRIKDKCLDLKDEITRRAKG